MKIACIGSSHLAALKQGWADVAQDYPDVHLTFFAAGAKSLSTIDVQGDKLISTQADVQKRLAVSSQGDGSIDPQAYDAFFILAGCPLFPIDRRVSSAVRERLTLSGFEASAGGNVIKKLRGLTDKEIFLGHPPLRREIEEPEDLGQPLPYEDALLERANLLSTHKLVLVPQPVETHSTVQGYRTKLELSLGSTRLKGVFSDSQSEEKNVTHPPSDLCHMNGDYGKIYLKHLIALMGAS